MKELRLSDRELQDIVGPALRAKLKVAGFVSGTPSNDHTAFFFPINLDLAGDVVVTRHEDATWSITQECDLTLLERTQAAGEAHVAAVVGRIEQVEQR